MSFLALGGSLVALAGAVAAEARRRRARWATRDYPALVRSAAADPVLRRAALQRLYADLVELRATRWRARTPHLATSNQEPRARAHLALAMLVLADGRPEEALGELRATKDLVANEAALTEARAHLTMRDVPRAAGALERCNELHLSDQDREAYVDATAQLLVLQGDVQGALARLRELSPATTTWPPPSLTRLRAQAILGQDSSNIWDELRALGPELLALLSTRHPAEPAGVIAGRLSAGENPYR